MPHRLDAARLRTIPDTPGAMLPDAGPSMQGVAQGATLGTGGEGKTLLESRLRARDVGTGDRIAQTTDQTFGHRRRL